MPSFKTFLAAYDMDTHMLVEGGNIWKDNLATKRIDRADVTPTLKWLEQLTGLPLVANTIGSTGRTATSGDLDVVVDQNKTSKDELASKLMLWAKKNDSSALVKKSGVSVHFRTPIKGNSNNGYVQTDFMFFPDIEFAKRSMVSSPTSKFTNANKAVLMASIAKSLGLVWSYMNGLMTRQEPRKLLRGGKDPEYIAKVLLGPSASASDLDSVETIMAKLKDDPERTAKLADAQETLGNLGVKL